MLIQNSHCTNYCTNGNCSNCGQCCTEFLPLTTDEVRLIKTYVKEKHIKPKFQIFSSTGFNTKCPFRDEENKKCLIYTVRPKICRLFKCNQTEKVIETHKRNRHKVAQYNKWRINDVCSSNVYSLRELIYGDKKDTIRLVVLQILLERFIRNYTKMDVQLSPTTVKETLIALKRLDLADLDLIKEILDELESYKKKPEVNNEN